MAKKSTVGRKKITDKMERVVPVTIYVKLKNKVKAQADCAAIAARYRN